MNKFYQENRWMRRAKNNWNLKFRLRRKNRRSECTKGSVTSVKSLVDSEWPHPKTYMVLIALRADSNLQIFRDFQKMIREQNLLVELKDLAFSFHLRTVAEWL